MAKPQDPESAARRDSYHHGNLTAALIEAAIGIIAERGVEDLSVREVAKRAGVSPGAPFRHFASKTALLTAVAEQTTDLFADSVELALAGWPEGDPAGALRRIGQAYLDWAIGNPVSFKIISSRELIDYSGSHRMVDRNDDLRATMRLWIERARTQGFLRTELDTEVVLLNCRAFVYGLARMWCDGHMAEWAGRASPAQAMRRGLDAFIEGLLRPA